MSLEFPPSLDFSLEEKSIGSGLGQNLNLSDFLKEMLIEIFIRINDINDFIALHITNKLFNEMTFNIAFNQIKSIKPAFNTKKNFSMRKLYALFYSYKEDIIDQYTYPESGFEPPVLKNIKLLGGPFEAHDILDKAKIRCIGDLYIRTPGQGVVSGVTVVGSLKNDQYGRKHGPYIYKGGLFKDQGFIKKEIVVNDECLPSVRVSIDHPYDFYGEWTSPDIIFGQGGMDIWFPCEFFLGVRENDYIFVEFKGRELKLRCRQKYSCLPFQDFLLNLSMNSRHTLFGQYTSICNQVSLIREWKTRYFKSLKF